MSDDSLHIQPTGDLDRLFEQAAEARPEFDRIMAAIEDHVGCRDSLPSRLKSEDRAREKAEIDYHGRADKLLDILRGSLVVDSLEQVDAIRAYLRNNTDVVRRKDRFREPLPHGHRDLTVNIRLGNGHVAELQVRLRELHNIRGVTHNLYEGLRALPASGLGEEARGMMAKQLMEQLQSVNNEAIARFNARTRGAKLTVKENKDGLRGPRKGP